MIYREKTLQEIKTLVERDLMVNLSHKTRKQKFVFARAVYYALSKRFTKYSLELIGKQVDRDHATVMHGLKVFSQMENQASMFEDELQAYAIISEMLELKVVNEETHLEKLFRQRNEMTEERNEVINKYETLKEKHNKLIKYFSKFERNAYDKYAEL